jgi:lipopolysaccharide export system permease protein
MGIVAITMGSIDKYIFRTTLASFALVLVSPSGVIWIMWLATSLTPAEVRNSFSTPETVSFWQLPSYIRSSESSGFATAGYRLQYQKLIAQPFLLAAMVMLAAAVSLRFFRFGGVQKMVLSGVGSGFLLYVLSKVTVDLSKAELMHPITAAWLPVCVGGLTGFLALLYQEDG